MDIDAVTLPDTPSGLKEIIVGLHGQIAGLREAHDKEPVSCWNRFVICALSFLAAKSEKDSGWPPDAPFIWYAGTCPGRWGWGKGSYTCPQPQETGQKAASRESSQDWTYPWHWWCRQNMRMWLWIKQDRRRGLGTTGYHSCKDAGNPPYPAQICLSELRRGGRWRPNGQNCSGSSANHSPVHSHPRSLGPYSDSEVCGPYAVLPAGKTASASWRGNFTNFHVQLGDAGGFGFPPLLNLLIDEVCPGFWSRPMKPPSRYCWNRAGTRQPNHTCGYSGVEIRTDRFWSISIIPPEAVMLQRHSCSTLKVVCKRTVIRAITFFDYDENNPPHRLLGPCSS